MTRSRADTRARIVDVAARLLADEGPLTVTTLGFAHRAAVTGRLRGRAPRAVDLIQAAGIGIIRTLLSVPTERRDLGQFGAIYEALLRQILTD